MTDHTPVEARFVPTTEQVHEAWMGRMPYTSFVERNEYELGWEAWLDGIREVARHDMDASLFNEIAGLLMSHPDMKALFAMERLRAQYGRSTRRALGLDERTITRD